MKTLKLALYGVLALLCWGCAPQNPNQPDGKGVTQDVTVNQIIGASPGTGSGSCEAVNKVTLNPVASFTHPGPVVLGFTSFGKSGARDRSCDQQSTEQWTSGGSSGCVVDRPGAVSPNLSAPLAGSCLVAVDVDGSSDSQNVTVN